MTSSNDQHGAPSFRCAVITVSDTLDEDADRPGSFLRVRLQKAGHNVALYRIIAEDPSSVRQAINKLAGQVDVVFLNGAEPGPPIDAALPALDEQFDRTIPGFRELFRARAYEEIGPLAMLSRATAGVLGQTLYFSLPGTLEGVRIGMEQLILPEFRDLVDVILSREPAA